MAFREPNGSSGWAKVASGGPKVVSGGPKIAFGGLQMISEEL